jgi:hypothetical protein
MDRKIKRTALIGTLVVLLVPCAFAQKQSTGTIIVFGVSNQFIAVATDSKIVEENTRNEKTTCKITTLGGKSVFAFTGMTFLQSTIHPELLWDAHAQALAAFQTARSLRVHTDPDFLVAVAQEWAQNANKALSRMTMIDADWFWRHIRSYADRHWRAFFGGFDDAGKIGIVEVRTTLDEVARTLGYEVSSYEENQETRFFAIGQTQVAAEFILLKTARAKKEYSLWDGTVRGKSSVQRASSRTIDLVRLSIKYLPADAGVGPPIQALILESMKPIRWVSGKECCQTNP